MMHGQKNIKLCITALQQINIFCKILAIFSIFSLFNFHKRGMRLRLRQWATSREIAVSIPDGITAIFYWHNTGRTINVGSIQPLKEMNTRNTSLGVQAAGA